MIGGCYGRGERTGVDIHTQMKIRRLEQQNSVLRAQLKTARETASFFASVIKSGESWTDQCEKALAAIRERGNE